MRRRTLRLLLGAAAALAVLGAAGLFAQRQARLRGAVNGLPDPERTPLREPALGVNADLTQYDDEALADNLDLIAATGFRWVRQPFRWSAIEPAPGKYDWAAADRIVEGAADRDLELVVVLLDAPEWAAAAPGALPADPAAFAAFAGAVAERYAEQARVYQVWDEPNLAAGWGGAPADPLGYAALLEAAYGAIHAADEDAFVLAAGLAPTVETGPENLSDLLYLRALYDNGAAPFFDGVAAKPYGFDTGPDDRRVHANQLNFSRMVLLREEMVRQGDARTPLWASHFGWNALPAGWAGGESAWGQTTAETQAAWTLAAYQRALDEWPWAGPLILEGWQPTGGPDDPRWGFALRGLDGALSPTAQALRVASKSINAALWPGVYPAQTPLAVYSGEWEFSALGADIVQDGGSVVEVPFVGDVLGVQVRRDNYRAYLYVTVDGAPPAVLPRDPRGAYLVLTSADYQPHVEVLPIATGYDDGEPHLARIEAERGWDQWSLAGFVVGGRVPTLAYDLSLGGLALLATALGIAAVRVRSGAGRLRPVRWLASRLGEGAHFGLAAVSALAVWLGAALTWGGLVPNVLRRIGEGPSLLITALTAGVFYFSPWLVLTLAALLVLFVLIYARPAVGLALIMFFTPFYLLPRPLFDRAFSMVEVLSLLTFGVWLLRTAADRRERGWPTLRGLWQSLTELDRAVGLFALVSVVSLAWSDLLGVAVTELRQMVLEPLVVYLVLRTMPLTARERWRIVDMLVLAGVVVSLYGFYQFATGTNLVAGEAGVERLRSVFGTPNNAALFLGRVIPLGAALGVMGRGRRRWLYGAAALVMTGAMALTLSKGGLLLGLPAGLAAVLILWLGRVGWLLVISGVVLEGLALIPLSRLPRFSGLVDFTSPTSTSFFRLQLWQSTLRLLRDHPLTGVGLDQFLYQYRSRYILPAAWAQPDLSQPHNLLLNYWVRLGLVGLAAGVWMQVAFWRMAARTHRRLRAADPAARALAAGLMGSMAAMLAHGLVDAVHFVIDLAFIFAMTLGLMHQLAAQGEQEATTP